MRGFHHLLSFLLLGISISFATPTAHSYKTRETILPPRGWVKRSTAPPNHRISLRIGLHQGNFDQLERELYRVSDPTHERYGKHLSKEEVEALVAPHPQSLSAVDEWLAEFDLKEHEVTRSPAKDWVIISVPVDLAEKMLDTVRLPPTYA